jgi:glutamate-ammonia-ligase adenylyltransferase
MAPREAERQLLEAVGREQRAVEIHAQRPLVASGGGSPRGLPSAHRGDRIGLIYPPPRAGTEPEAVPEIEEFVAALAAGDARPEPLARFGEDEPQRALAAFARARARPELAAELARWAPEALRSARPAAAVEQLVELAERHQALAGAALDVARHAGLPRLLGSSAFLARLLAARPAWLAELADAEGGVPGPPSCTAVAPEWDAIREAKYRGLLRVAGRDLCGRPFRDGLTELSRLADACLGAALACAAAETGAAPPALLAVGKLGGRELNFSSDVDLLFVYPTPPTMEEDFARNREVARVVRAFRTGLEARGVLGFGYRVDLELRPEGETGPLANSVDGALAYYESFGAEWERQALIRLRHVAGPAPAAEALLLGLAPFVWRRSISPAALHAVRDMKQRIERERREAGRDLELDLKEGPGGIRDVEFLAQALQLFTGGREPRVRSGNVLEALASLAEVGALPGAGAAALARGYLWLRRAEHALQLDEERQTHAFPREPRGQRALARRMGYGEDDAEAARARLLADWSSVRSEVRAHFEELLPAERR